MNNVQQDLYSLIGVSPTAALEEIEDACLRLAEKYRPDKNPNNPEAAQSFAAIEQAFEILGNPAKRAAYDSAQQRQVTSNSEPIKLKHSFVGYLGAAVGGSIMLLAFHTKPTEPGLTAMLIGGVITTFCLIVAIRAVPKTGQHGKSADEAARSVNKAISSAISTAVALVAGVYIFFYWGGLGSSPQPHQTVRPPVAITAPPQSSTPACDISAATKVRSNFGQMMVAQEFRNQMAYSISADWWGTIRPRLGELVRAAANADACLAGKARRIDFYGPDGKRVAFADPNKGIRLLVD